MTDSPEKYHSKFRRNTKVNSDRELMQQALEALETGWPVVADLFRVDHVLRYEAAITALRERLAREEQPAVREVVHVEKDGTETWRKVQPAVREWQSLTEQEIYPLYSEPSSDAEMVEFARAIEAKLKEKNA